MQPQQQLTNVPDITGLPRQIVAGAARTLLPSTTPSDYIDGPIQALTHPLDSISLLWDAIKDASLRQGSKAAEAVRATRDEPTTQGKLGRTVEAIGHSTAAVVPILGPAAAQAGEQIGAGNYGEGVGEALGLLAPTLAPHGAGAVKTVAGAIKKPLAAASESLRTTVADAAARGVERRLVDVAAPKTGANKVRFGNDVARVAPTLAREPGLGAGSRTGLQSKVESRLADAESALDDAANARLSARTFPTKPIIDGLLAKRKALTAETVEGSGVRPGTLDGLVDTSKPGASGKEFGRVPPTSVTERTGAPIGTDVVPGPNATRVAEIDRAISEIKQLGPVARYEPLRRIREAYDGPAKAVYSPSMTADFLKAQGGKMGAADVTGVLREHLANMDPKTAAANADYTLFRRAADALKASEETERVRPNMFRKTMGRVAGASTGGATGGTAGAVAGVLTADFLDALGRSGLTTKIQTARLLATLEDAIRGNKTAQVDLILDKLRRMTAVASKASITMGRTQTAAR